MLHKKVKHAVILRGIGGVLISLSVTVEPIPRKWMNHCVRDARPVQRQTYSYLPSCRASPPFGRYQIILLGEHRHMCMNNLPNLAVPQLKVKPATMRSSVRHVTTTPPSCILTGCSSISSMSVHLSRTDSKLKKKFTEKFLQ